MKDDELRKLIFDMNLLIYIHDILALRDKDEAFMQSDTISKLKEKNQITVFRYLKRTVLNLITFILTLSVLKMDVFSNSVYKYGIFLIVSLIFTKKFVTCKEDISDLVYQLRAKRAVLYALEHYTYQEFLVFLDLRMSEMSTVNYFREINKKNN